MWRLGWRQQKKAGGPPVAGVHGVETTRGAVAHCPGAKRALSASTALATGYALPLTTASVEWNGSCTARRECRHTPAAVGPSDS